MKKRLYKIEQGKKLDGVCGGIAEYFDIDPNVTGKLYKNLRHEILNEKNKQQIYENIINFI